MAQCAAPKTSDTIKKAPDCETERCPLPVAVAVGPACGGTAIGEPA